jgi:hypothetical protein
LIAHSLEYRNLAAATPALDIRQQLNSLADRCERVAATIGRAEAIEHGALPMEANLP